MKDLCVSCGNNPLAESLPNHHLCDPCLANEPTKREVVKMVQRRQWSQLSEMFEFEPVFIEVGGRRYFDWRSAPPAMMSLLGERVPHDPERVAMTPEYRRKRSSKIYYPNPVRSELYQVQKGICHYCREHIEFREWTIDHVKARSAGGSSEPENLVGACQRCNGMKGMMDAETFTIMLRNGHFEMAMA